MTCTNPQCANPRKDHVALFAGNLCSQCKHLYVAPIKSGKPKFIPKSSPDKLAYGLAYMREKQGVEKGQFVVECDGLYRIRRCMLNGVRLTWGDRKQAKIYQSRALAEYAVRKIGKGRVEKVI